MQQDHFDDIIKDKLQNLQVDFQPEHWDLFADQLDQPAGDQADLPNEDFDQLVFDKLQRFEAPTQQRDKHWALLQAQMDNFYQTREILLRYKLVEAILVSLFLLITIKAGMPEPKLNLSPAHLPQALLTVPSTTTTDSEEAITKQQDNSVQGLSSDAQRDLDAQQEPTGAPTQDIPTGDYTAASSAEHLPIQPLMASTPKPVESQKAASPLTRSHSKAASQYQELNTTALLKGQSLLLDAVPANVLPSLAGLAIKGQTHIRVSMLGGADYNRIMTPENLPKRIRAYERVAVGYRGGLLLDFNKDQSPFSFGAGMIYTAKQYEVGYQRINGSLLRRNGLSAEELQNIELNMINIPIFARYNLLDKQRWAIYAQTGLALQVAAQANYYVGYPNHLPQPVGVQQTPSNASKISGRTGGLLEGGSFKQNSFFTGNAGFGIERSMAERWMFFAQTRYEYSIGYLSAGLGPTQDRINTLSLETGIRVKLK